MKHLPRARWLVSVCASIVLGGAVWGCGAAGATGAIVKPISAAPARKAPANRAPDLPPVFQHPALSANPTYPFARSWVDPSVDFTRFSRIAIAPVSLAHLRPLPTAIQGQVDGNARKEAAVDAAMKMRDALENAAVRSGVITVVRDAGAHTVIATAAILQLVPTLSERAAGQEGAQLLVGGMRTELSKPISVRPGKITMVTTLRDGANNRIVARFLDTARPVISPSLAAAPSDYGFTRSAIDRWAKDLIRMITSTTAAGPVSR